MYSGEAGVEPSGGVGEESEADGFVYTFFAYLCDLGRFLLIWFCIMKGIESW